MATEERGTGDLEEKIIDVLRASGQPMKAADIAKSLGRTKKEINQVIYNINAVVRSEKNPPLWKLAESASTPTRDKAESVSEPQSQTQEQSTLPPAKHVATSLAKNATDEHLRHEILAILTEPLHAPDVARKLPRELAVENKDVKRVLYDLEKEGLVENRAAPKCKPLWALTTGGKCSARPQTTADSQQARFRGQPLYTKLETENEIIFREIKQGEIEDASLGVLMEPPSVPSSQIQTKHTAETHSMAGGVEEEEDVKQKPPATVSSSSDDLDQGFAGLAISLSKKEMELVRKFLQEHRDEQFTSRQVAEEIGAESRDLVMAYLEELAGGGKVYKREDGKFTHYRWNGKE